MKKYTLEYKNVGTTRVIGTVCANNPEELQQMIANGTIEPEIEDIQFDNPEGEYTILNEEVMSHHKRDPIIPISEVPFMNPPE